MGGGEGGRKEVLCFMTVTFPGIFHIFTIMHMIFSINEEYFG